jgi:hypothetical protein
MRDVQKNERVDRVREVRFDELSPGDVLTLRTQNSEYRFEITDPANRTGTLKGGRIAAAREAVLGGVVDEESDYWGDGARSGARALFFLLGPQHTQGFNRILTSEVQSIQVRHDEDRRAA